MLRCCIGALSMFYCFTYNNHIFPDIFEQIYDNTPPPTFKTLRHSDFLHITSFVSRGFFLSSHCCVYTEMLHNYRSNTVCSSMNKSAWRRKELVKPKTISNVCSNKALLVIKGRSNDGYCSAFVADWYFKLSHNWPYLNFW